MSRLKLQRRMRISDGSDSHRWVISYADFMTLLFAFFVVMYAISSVNEGKYRVLANALDAVFATPPKSFSPIQIGKISKDLSVQTPTEAQFNSSVTDAEQQGYESKPYMDELAYSIETSFKNLIEDEMMDVRQTDDWIEIEFKSEMLFISGDSVLNANARGVIQKLSTLIKRFPNPVQIEGHTDSLPIKTEKFPSNWELSASRAAAVVRALQKEGVSSQRLRAVGFADAFPVDSNTSRVGRGNNRRVVMVITRADPRKPLSAPIKQPKSSVSEKKSVISNSSGDIDKLLKPKESVKQVEPKRNPDPLKAQKLPGGGVLFSVRPAEKEGAE